MRGVGLLFVSAIHGFAMAGAARLLGDSGPKYDDRLTANPLDHLDVIGSVGVVLFWLGWTKPVAIDQTKLRFGRVGLILIVLIALLATLLSATVFGLLRTPAVMLLPHAAALTMSALLSTMAQMSIWFALFNVLPIPPLSGSQLVVAAVPAIKEHLSRYQLYFALALAVLIMSGVLLEALRPAYRALAALLLVS